MNNKIWAVGDIHGHFNELQRLYEEMLKSGLNPDEDQVVFLGDYVDGGPATREVIEWLIDKEAQYPHWKFLFGNHEDLMIDALVWNGMIYDSYHLWWGQGGRETTASYKPPLEEMDEETDEEKKYKLSLLGPEDVFPTAHLAWLTDRPYWYETDDYFFVHAGLVPGKSIEEHKKASRIKNKQANLIEQMLWIRDEFIGSKYDWGKKIIFGHTVFPYKHYFGQDRDFLTMNGAPYVTENKIGIDGMHHNTGKLIAVKLPDEKFVTVKSAQ